MLGSSIFLHRVYYYPRPTNGILVANMVINCTLVSKDMLEIVNIASAT